MEQMDKINCGVKNCKHHDISNHCTANHITVGCDCGSAHNVKDTICETFEECDNDQCGEEPCDDDCNCSNENCR